MRASYVPSFLRRVGAFFRSGRRGLAPKPRDMRPLIARTTFFLVVSGGLLLTRAVSTYIPAIASLVPGAELGPDKVLVFLVEENAGVDRVRRAVDPSRIVWSTPDAVALKEGRIVAAGHASVGDVITKAGWIDLEIEIFTVAERDMPSSGAGKGELSPDVDSERMARLRELITKPTLSNGEQILVLKAMNDGVEF